MSSWVVAGFSDRTPYPTGKRSDWGAVGRVCRGWDEGIFGTFLLRGIGLIVLLELPNSYPCITHPTALIGCALARTKSKIVAHLPAVFKTPRID